MKVRRALTQDVAYMAWIEEQVWRSHADHSEVPMQADAIAERMYLRCNDLAAHDFFFLVENDDGEVIGFAAAGLPDLRSFAEYRGELDRLYILPAYQRQGLGRMLVQTVIEEFFNRGVTSFYTWVCLNGAGPQFFDELGGVRLGERTQTIGNSRLPEIAYGLSFSFC